MVSFAAAALLSLLLLAAAPPSAPVSAAVLAWAALAALAWLLPLTWLLLWGARFLEPGRVSLLLLLEVAVAALSAALLAGEPLGLREASGCLLILAAGALEGAAELRPARRAALLTAVRRPERRRRPRSPHSLTEPAPVHPRGDLRVPVATDQRPRLCSSASVSILALR